jgi:hypothetical protein
MGEAAGIQSGKSRRGRGAMEGVLEEESRHRWAVASGFGGRRSADDGIERRQL